MKILTAAYLITFSVGTAFLVGCANSQSTKTQKQELIGELDLDWAARRAPTSSNDSGGDLYQPCVSNPYHDGHKF